jgi:hypothetical protein
MFNKKYIKLLEQELDSPTPDPPKDVVIPPSKAEPEEVKVKDKTLPDIGKSPEDGLVVSKPGVIHYVPNDLVSIVKSQGLKCQRMMSSDPEFRKTICQKYGPYVQHKLGVDAGKIDHDSIMHFLDMIHPGITRSIFAFFNRIPHGIPHLQNFVATHTPVRIVLKKLDSAKDGDFKTYGVNFPHTNKWHVLNDDQITKLSDKNRDWFGYFSEADPYKLFRSVPHAAIVPSKGIIPPFCLKVLDGEDD